jgi:hypothetical protein
MPLDFPSSPTNGQAYQGYVYSTSIGAWQAKPSAQSPFYAADIPPANPVVGDAWFNTNDGTMYVYYNDGNTFQWVEHRSEIARSQVGLVPVVPTSVAVASGSASFNSSGLITFTGATSISVNGCFTSSFRNYRILFDETAGSVYTDGNMRLRSAGTDVAGTGYFRNGVLVDSTSVQGFSNQNDSWIGNIVTIHPSTTAHAQSAIEVRGPFLAAPTTFQAINHAWSGSIMRFLSLGGFHTPATSYDGFSIILASGNFAGTLKIYGYN